MASPRPPKLPESGQWPDKLAPALVGVGLLASLAGFLMTFLVLPPVNGAGVSGAALIGGQVVTAKLLISQKIFFFHMPVAIVSFAALCFAAYYSARYLMTRCERFDTCARTAMDIALLFVVLTMITGEMWTRFEWGVWWTWDPRLTTYLVLMLVVIVVVVMVLVFIVIIVIVVVMFVLVLVIVVVVMFVLVLVVVIVEVFHFSNPCGRGGNLVEVEHSGV